ncbi:phosphate/phosphoenolpyruvate translocator [Sphingopyxis macrogoltabida]|nr:phosphate/phosphoenolpyruvate translocator [Sphingopyxis macrogoltabida]
MFPSVPLKRAAGDIGLVPDVPCPHREIPTYPRSRRGAERPKGPAPRKLFQQPEFYPSRP